MTPDEYKLTQTSSQTILVRLGKNVFRVRLMAGLLVAAVALEFLKPQPFFGEGHRAIQSFSLVMIAGGLGLRAWATGCAGDHTRLEKLDAPRLVTTGPFAYLRNPIYAGTICLALGMVLLIGDFVGLILAVIALMTLYISIVPAEEAYLLNTFGHEYMVYKANVPRFIPRLTAWRQKSSGTFHWRALWGEGGIALLLVAIYGCLWLEEFFDHVVG